VLLVTGRWWVAFDGQRKACCTDTALLDVSMGIDRRGDGGAHGQGARVSAGGR
jgi:hypothetical protein